MPDIMEDIGWLDTTVIASSFHHLWGGIAYSRYFVVVHFIQTVDNFFHCWFSANDGSVFDSQWDSVNQFLKLGCAGSIEEFGVIVALTFQFL